MMAFLISRRLLFVHVPKTGGKEALDRMRRIGVQVRPVRSPGCHVGHATEAESRDRRYSWNFRFGFIRRPADWWLSLWKFAETPESKLFDIAPDIRHPFGPLMPWLRRGLSPDDFVGELLNRVPGFYGAMLADYLDGADFVGRTDNLGPSLLAGLRAGGVEVRREQAEFLATRSSEINASRPRVSHASLTPRMSKMVELFEPDACRRFAASGVYTETGELEK